MHGLISATLVLQNGYNLQCYQPCFLYAFDRAICTVLVCPAQCLSLRGWPGQANQKLPVGWKSSPPSSGKGGQIVPGRPRKQRLPQTSHPQLRTDLVSFGNRFSIRYTSVERYIGLGLRDYRQLCRHRTFRKRSEGKLDAFSTWREKKQRLGKWASAEYFRCHLRKTQNTRGDQANPEQLVLSHMSRIQGTGWMQPCVNA